MAGKVLLILGILLIIINALDYALAWSMIPMWSALILGIILILIGLFMSKGSGSGKQKTLSQAKMPAKK